MGEFKGAASFFLAPRALVQAGHEMHVSMPRGGDVAVSGERSGGTAARRWKANAAAPAGEDYHGILLHRYGLAVDFMPLGGNRLWLHLTLPFRYAYYFLRATAAAFAAARACEPDVVVGYGAWAAPVAYLVARSMGLPNVTRLFGQSLPARGPRGFREVAKTVLNFPEVIAFTTRCAALILHNDGSGGDKVARRLGVPSGRLHFLLNGVDKELFSPPASRAQAKESLGLSPDAPLLLSVSRLDAEKHHGRLIRALPEVLERFPQAQAFIVGEGPERGRLQEQASRLGVSSSVKMPGALSREEVARYYKACDLFLSLSDRTNATNTTLEAMCCGACVLAIDAAETSETLGGGGNAVLLPRERLPELGRVILELLEDEAKRTAIGKAGAAFAAGRVPSVEQRSRMEAEVVEAAARGA